MPIYPISKLNKIKYDSPSGFVNVGKYIPPFEKVENGFGYMGVVLEDCDSGKIQCNICGKWFEQMAVHLKTQHDSNSQNYKIRFGLLTSTALKSKKMRLNQSVIMQKLRRRNKSNRKGFKKGNSFAGNRKGKPKAFESRNKFGICDLQICNKILELKKDLNKTPTLTELKDVYGNSFIFQIHKRYSSYIKLCHKLRLNPNFSSFNPKYSKKYFIKKGMDAEPSIRILTTNEGRALYKYFKGGVKEWKKAVQVIKVREKR